MGFHTLTKASARKDTSRQWSEMQDRIFAWFEIRPVQGEYAPGAMHSMMRHLVVRARAGTGKTTTIIEGINRAPEKNILLCAFNKRIATELSSRITNPHAEAKTLHAIGFAAIREQWGRIDVSDWRGADLTKKVVPADTPKAIQTLITKLHTKAREMMATGEPTLKKLTELAFFFDLVPDEEWGKYDVDFVVKAASRAVRWAGDEDRPKNIDYADMIFQPLVRKWLQPAYDLVVVDEGQDMTEAQLRIAQRVCKSSGRLCIVGDDKQAIYAFRGADSGSLDRLKAELGASELPLNVTYRCGQDIVREAQRLVPDIQAAPTNALGAVVEDFDYDKMMSEVRAGDFILSRLNAPLVAITLKLLARQVRARMAGRDLGTGVLNIIKKMKCQESDIVEKLVSAVITWESATVTRYMSYGQNGNVDRVRDQAGMIYALADGIELPEAEGNRPLTVRDLINTCNYLFEEPGDSAKTHVICSSVHKAKGLETERVWLLQQTLYRRGMSQEEQNIEYVAVTRAKSQLTRVINVPGF